MERKNFKWGIVSPGRIAHKFAIGLSAVPGAQLWAVAGRNSANVGAFAAQYDAPQQYNSLESMLANSGIDALYIASPNTLHYEQTMLALEHKVPVLCEKPLTLNVQMAKAMYAKAKTQNTFLMEAMWTSFLPHMQAVRKSVADGAIGEPKYLRADFGYIADPDPKSRIFDPGLGGGALLDIGIYPLYLALTLFGPVSSWSLDYSLSDTGIDKEESIMLRHTSGQVSQLVVSVCANLPTTATIGGTQGSIHIDPQWLRPVHFDIELHGAAISRSRHLHPVRANGFEYEAEELMRCVAAGQLESSIVPWALSLQVVELMDAMRKQMGITYPAEAAVAPTP